MRPTPLIILFVCLLQGAKGDFWSNCDTPQGTCLIELDLQEYDDCEEGSQAMADALQVSVNNLHGSGKSAVGLLQLGAKLKVAGSRLPG